MATPPTRVSYNTPALGYGSNTSPKTTPAFDVVAGDLITLVASSEDSPVTLGTPTATGGSITWTSRQSIVVSSYCTMYAWTGAVGATATGITVSVARTAGTLSYSFGVTVWRNHGGVGTTAKTNVASGAPSLALATSANSAVVCGSDDWSAADGTTRTWRTVNGSAMTESLYFRNSLTYTVYSGYAPDTGAAGTTTVGLSAPGAQKYSIVGIEVLGTSSGSSFSGGVATSGSGTLTLAGTPAETGAAGFSGGGSLSFAGTPTIPGGAPLSGGGSLSLAATPAIPGSVSTTGSGALTLGGTPAIPGAAGLSGSGTLTLSGAAVYLGALALSGAGTLTFSGTPRPGGSAGLTGAGVLTFTATPSMPGAAGLSGSGTLSGAATPGETGSVAFSGLGVLTLSGVVGGGGSNFSGLAMLTGSGSLGTSATPAFAATLTLGGSGILTLSTGGTVYQFITPGHEMPVDPTGKDFLWSRVKYIQGDAVIKYRDGTYKLVQVHDPDEPNIDTVYLGGHVHTVSDAEAILLIQAGYGSYLTVVTA